MSRPREFPLNRLLCAGLSFFFATMGEAQTLPDEALEDWYRVELLVFLREDAESLSAEQWPALPSLSYNSSLRYLVDQDLADRRLLESSALQSQIDERGVQKLLFPAPFSILDDSARPDALITEPWVDPEALVPDPNSTDPAFAGELAEATQDPTDAESSLGEDDTPDEGEPPQIPLVTPYQLVDQSTLDFNAQARSLRRRGERVAFHGGWWVELRADEPQDWIALDRGADMDTRDWPELQGAVHIYRSRYLHVDVNLWLNTLAAYLPEGWQIDPPPLPPESLLGRTIDGSEINPWQPEPYPGALTGIGSPNQPRSTGSTALEVTRGAGADPAPTVVIGEGDSVIEEGDSLFEDAQSVPEDDEPETLPYPWRHAIVHNQSRRMRSQETHYLDHPVIGVIIRVTPASEELPPVADEKDLPFRERHGLPVTLVPAEG